MRARNLASCSVMAAGELVAELREVLLGVVHLGGPGVGSDREELRPDGLVNVQAVEVESSNFG